MTITTVRYGRTYGLPNYGSERIDLEASIDPEEPIEMVVEILKGKCDSIHKANNPQLYYSQYVSTPPEFAAATGIHTIYTNNPDTFKQPEVKITPEEEQQSLLEEIANATAETIEQWEIPALRNVKTKGAYSLRLKQLNLQ